MNLASIKSAWPTLVEKVETIWKERGTRAQEDVMKDIRGQVAEMTETLRGLISDNEALSAENERLEAAHAELTGERDKLKADLKLENEKVAEWEKKYESAGKQASIIANKNGLRAPLPIKVDDPTSTGGAKSKAEEYLEMKPGPAKTAFYRQHKAAIVAAARG